MKSILIKLGQEIAKVAIKASRPLIAKFAAKRVDDLDEQIDREGGA